MAQTQRVSSAAKARAVAWALAAEQVRAGRAALEAEVGKARAEERKRTAETASARAELSRDVRHHVRQPASICHMHVTNDNDGYGSPRLPIPPCHPPQVEALAAEASRWLVDDDALWGCAHAFRLTANRLVAAAASGRAASSEHRRLVGGACSSARATATAVLRSCCSADSPVIGTDTGAIVGHHDTAALLGGDGGGGTTMGEVPANRFQVWSGELLRRHETLLSGTVWREEYGVLTSGGTLHLFDAAGVVVAKNLPPASPLLSLPCAAARIEREGKRTGRCPQ